MTGSLRPVAVPFVAAAPAGARVRTRLRLSPGDEAVLQAVGAHLGSLAGRDLASRCAEGRLDAQGRARSRAVRKRALTAASSSRWAGAITRTSEDQYRLAGQNLRAGRSSLTARIRSIEARLAVPVGGKAGKARGYATTAERHSKTIRLQALKARLGQVQRQLDSGVVSVARGGKALLRKRNNLGGAGLTESQWRREWESSRLFLTADGEKDKAWGNETIRWNPDTRRLEVKLPAPLARLANQPHGRYRLSGTVEFGYRGDEVAAQASTGAVRYDITRCPHPSGPSRDRWYIDASWKATPTPVASLEELLAHGAPWPTRLRGAPERPRAVAAHDHGRHGASRRLAGAGGVEEAEGVRPGGGLAAAGDAQLAEDVGHVDAGRLGRDEQLGGYLPVAAPGRDQAEHLEFAFGEAELGPRVAGPLTLGRVVAGQPDPGAPGEDRDLLGKRVRAQFVGQRGRAPQPFRRAVAVAAGQRGLGRVQQRLAERIRLAEARPRGGGGVPGADQFPGLAVAAHHSPAGAARLAGADGGVGEGGEQAGPVRVGRGKGQLEGTLGRAERR